MCAEISSNLQHGKNVVWPGKIQRIFASGGRAEPNALQNSKVCTGLLNRSNCYRCCAQVSVNPGLQPSPFAGNAQFKKKGDVHTHTRKWYTSILYL